MLIKFERNAFTIWFVWFFVIELKSTTYLINIFFVFFKSFERNSWKKWIESFHEKNEMTNTFANKSIKFALMMMLFIVNVHDRIFKRWNFICSTNRQKFFSKFLTLWNLSIIHKSTWSWKFSCFIVLIYLLILCEYVW